MALGLVALTAGGALSTIIELFILIFVLLRLLLHSQVPHRIVMWTKDGIEEAKAFLNSILHLLEPGNEHLTES